MTDHLNNSIDSWLVLLLLLLPNTVYSLSGSPSVLFKKTIKSPLSLLITALPWPLTALKLKSKMLLPNHASCHPLSHSTQCLQLFLKPAEPISTSGCLPRLEHSVTPWSLFSGSSCRLSHLSTQSPLNSHLLREVFLSKLDPLIPQVSTL